VRFWIFSIKGNQIELFPSLSVVLKELNTVGYVWIYLNQGAPPTPSQYIASDSNSASNYHRFEIRFKGLTNESSIFYIGVYGSPLEDYFRPADYTLTAYSPQF